jgi:hypothetical protein
VAKQRLDSVRICCQADHKEAGERLPYHLRIVVLQIRATSLAQLLATIFVIANSLHYPLTQQALSKMNIRRLAATVPSLTQYVPNPKW